MDENDSEELLINPCSCKGTSEYVHIKCIQDWITSKMKKKINLGVSCFYWKKLKCEVCIVSLPDLIEHKTKNYELIPIERPLTPYILLERVFYDKAKENGDHSKIFVLMGLSNETHQIKLVYENLFRFRLYLNRVEVMNVISEKMIYLSQDYTLISNIKMVIL